MYLIRERIDVEELVRRIYRPSDGAVVTFSGVVRNHHAGRSVVSIDYQAYESMAEKEIEAVVSDVSSRYRDVTVAVVHRLGLLEVGDVSIAIACASPHRLESFAACRELIDQIKQSVPIWKKERSEDGEEWVGWQST
jgi:molybdopterin synthase catalytic subunit